MTMNDPTIEALQTIIPSLSHSLLAAAISRTIEQYKQFGLYSEEIDVFLDSVAAVTELIMHELKEAL